MSWSGTHKSNPEEYLLTKQHALLAMVVIAHPTTWWLHQVDEVDPPFAWRVPDSVVHEFHASEQETPCSVAMGNTKPDRGFGQPRLEREM